MVCHLLGDMNDPSKFLMPVVERFLSEESEMSDISVPTGPGPMCSLCNCGEKSLLGQGELARFDPTPGFNPFKRPLQRKRSMGEAEDSKGTWSPLVVYFQMAICCFLHISLFL